MIQIIIISSLKLICPMISVYSLFLFLKGHNSPGGGFIGGLMLSLAIILWLMANPKSKLRDWIKERFLHLISICLLGLFFIAIFPLFLDAPVLKGIWSNIPLPLAGKFSSILLFDLFIYLIVAFSSVFAYIAFTLREGLET